MENSLKGDKTWSFVYIWLPNRYGIIEKLRMINEPKEKRPYMVLIGVPMQA